MIYIVNILFCILNIWFIKNYLHIYQLKDYNNVRFLKFFNKKYKIYYIFNIILFIFSIFIKNYYILFSINCICLLYSCFTNINIIKNKKTPLVFTPKIKRLYAINIFLLIIFIFLYRYIIFINIILPFFIIFSKFINFYDVLKNRKFIKMAKDKIKNSNVKIIAITGSNGKTSVKNILSKMLNKKYLALPSPKSFNTPLGISKFINDSDLGHVDYLILEYGARHKNDIKKLCYIFGCDYGIITAIAPQHLQTFKTLENIYSAKKELSDFLEEKFCVYNLDNIYALRMHNNKIGEKIGISIYQTADIFADNISIRNYKTNFNLHIENEVYNITTKLLGDHNVTNILLSTALAKHLNVDIKDILIAITQLEFTPHRLELIKTNINIFDDSYNCSLLSAKKSIEVLQTLPNKKMVATPGIIEAGKDEFKVNSTLGEMCSVFDFVVIIGEHNKDALLTGLKNKNYTKKICFAKSLDEAKQYFSLLNSNDNLLLLNDLPDDYY